MTVEVRQPRQLQNLANVLQANHPSAAASLREGLDETLTVLRFGLSDTLLRTLSTTNPIEKATLPDGAIFRGMHRPDPHGRPVVFAVDYSLPGDPVELEHFRQHTVTFNWG